MKYQIVVNSWESNRDIATVGFWKGSEQAPNQEYVCLGFIRFKNGRIIEAFK